jgi:hypothetical protein
MSGSELTPCVLFGTQGHGNEARVAAAFIAALQAVRQENDAALQHTRLDYG